MWRRDRRGWVGSARPPLFGGSSDFTVLNKISLGFQLIGTSRIFGWRIELDLSFRVPIVWIWFWSCPVVGCAVVCVGVPQNKNSQHCSCDLVSLVESSRSCALLGKCTCYTVRPSWNVISWFVEEFLCLPVFLCVRNLNVSHSQLLYWISIFSSF
jgi:hypothetical protein